MKTSIQRIVNGVVWIASGIILIVVRALLPQTISTPIWEIIGAGMIVYGTVRLAWLFKTSDALVPQFNERFWQVPFAIPDWLPFGFSSPIHPSILFMLMRSKAFM